MLKKIVYRNATKIASFLLAFLVGIGAEFILGDGSVTFRLIITIIIIKMILLLIPLFFIGENFLAEYYVARKKNNCDSFDTAYEGLNATDEYKIIGIRPNTCIKIIFLSYIVLIFTFGYTYTVCSNPQKVSKDRDQLLIKTITEDTSKNLNLIQVEIINAILFEIDLKIQKFIEMKKFQIKPDSLAEMSNSLDLR